MKQEDIIKIQLEILQNEIKEMNRVMLLINKLTTIQSKLQLYQVEGKYRTRELSEPPCGASSRSYNTQWDFQVQINNIQREIDCEKIPNYIPKTTDEYWQMNGIKGKENGWKNISGNYFRILQNKIKNKKP